VHVARSVAVIQPPADGGRGRKAATASMVGTASGALALGYAPELSTAEVREKVNESNDCESRDEHESDKADDEREDDDEKRHHL